MTMATSPSDLPAGRAGGLGELPLGDSPLGGSPLGEFALGQAALGESALAQRCMDAFEREFWSGHHHRGRLVAEPLRVIRQSLDPGDDAGALLETLLHTLETGWPGRR